MEEQTKRTRRKITTEEKIAELQDKIQGHVNKINELNKKIEELKTPQITFKDVSARIKELDVPISDVLKAVEKLGKK